MGNMNLGANSKKKQMGDTGDEDLHLHLHMDKSVGEILQKMRVSMTVNEIFVRLINRLGYSGSLI